MTAVVGLVGLLVLGALGSAIGSELHAGSPRLAKRLLRSAARRIPNHESHDFVDEVNDIVDGYRADGLYLSALAFSTNEWCRVQIHRGIPAMLADQRNELRIAAALGPVGFGIFMPYLVDFWGIVGFSLLAPPASLVFFRQLADERREAVVLCAANAAGWIMTAGPVTAAVSGYEYAKSHGHTATSHLLMALLLAPAVLTVVVGLASYLIDWSENRHRIHADSRA